MKTELIIANKSVGKMWEISNSVPEVTWSTERTGSPGTLKFNVLKAGDLSFAEGDIVRFSVDGQLQFYGWVFTKSKDRWGEIQVTCYDRIRYLKANASYNFEAQTAGDMLRQIAADLQIDVGQVADTGYAIPDFYKEDESCLDILGEAIQQTLLNTGNIYVLFDDGNGLALRQPRDMVSNVVIGDMSLLTDYTYKTDIDEQTYNHVKLARPNEETGRADVFVAEDSATMGQWGMLQLYQTVDGTMNDAQVQAQARAAIRRRGACRFLGKRFKDMGDEFLTDPNPRIIDNEPQDSVVLGLPAQGGRECHLTALLGKLDCVAQDIDQHPLQLHGVAHIIVIQDRVHDTLIVHAPCSGLGITDGVNPVQEIFRGDFFIFKKHLPALNPAHVQDIINQGQQETGKNPNL